MCLLTSAGIRQLGAPQEAQVAGPRPHSLGVTEAQLGAEVVGMQRLLPVHGVVAGGVVRAAHPHLDMQDDTHGLLKADLEAWQQSVSVCVLMQHYLPQVGVTQGSLCLRVGNDDLHSRKNLQKKQTNSTEWRQGRAQL